MLLKNANVAYIAFQISLYLQGAYEIIKARITAEGTTIERRFIF